MTKLNNEDEDNTGALTKPVTASKFTSDLQFFDFKDEAIDTALRKLLAKVLLPKEAQQIDRAMEDFAKHYHMCNPSLANGFDSIYAVAFSILLLHTDAHNKNIKRKMDKDTFITRTKEIGGGRSVSSELLDVMYDNIVYSEFTYAHEQQDRSSSWFTKKTSLCTSTLLHDLSPKLEQLMPASNIFRYKPAPNSDIDITSIHQSIEQAQSLPLSGVRYRQQETDVDRISLVKVCKYGVIERKSDLSLDGKRSSARGWRPFGMALSGSQIMFFGDLMQFQSWTELQQPHRQPVNSEQSKSKPLCSKEPPPCQSLDSSISSLKTDTPTITSSSTSYLSIIPSSMSLLTSSVLTASPSPPYSTTLHLQPVQIVTLSNAVCVYDESYQKYPHVFRLVTGDKQQFLIQGDNAADIDDWIQKINYVSAMKSTGVRLRPKMVTIKPAVSNRNISHPEVPSDKEHNQLGTHHYHQYHHRDGYSSQHWAKREAKARATMVSLSRQLDEHKYQLAKDEQLRNQFMVLAPRQKATKERMLVFAERIGKRLMDQWIVLRRLECYQEVIEMELFFYQSFKDHERSSRDNVSRHSDSDSSDVKAVTRRGNSAVTRQLSDPSTPHHGLSKERLITTSTNQSWSSSSPEITMTGNENGNVLFTIEPLM